MRARLAGVPRDLLLYGRLFALVTGTMWVLAGSLIVAPIAALALAILFATIVYS